MRCQIGGLLSTQLNIRLEEALDAAIEAAREAGDYLRSAFIGPRQADDQDEVAHVDLRAEEMIRLRLQRCCPGFGFIAEERPEMNIVPTDGNQPYWLVDPHDGTSGFNEGYRGASVSIGLINQGRPVLGVVYAYSAPDDRGDFVTWAEGCGPVMRNDVAVHSATAKSALSPGDVVYVSRNADYRGKEYAKTLTPARFYPSPGIAYRLALAAVGEGGAAISLSAPRDFDCAGGHALLIGAGMDLYDERGRPIHYIPGKAPLAGFCFGGSQSICSALSKVDWSSILRAARTPLGPYGPRRPRNTAICADGGRLSRARGAWAGFLVGGFDLGAPSSPEPKRSETIEFARFLACNLVNEWTSPITCVSTSFSDWRKRHSGRPNVCASVPVAIATWNAPGVLAQFNDAIVRHIGNAQHVAKINGAILAIISSSVGRGQCLESVSAFVQQHLAEAGVNTSDMQQEAVGQLRTLEKTAANIDRGLGWAETLSAAASFGDSQSVARALTGALYGSIKGEDSIPLELRRNLSTLRPSGWPSDCWNTDWAIMAEQLVCKGALPE